MKSILCEEKKKREYAKLLFYPTIIVLCEEEI